MGAPRDHTLAAGRAARRPAVRQALPAVPAELSAAQREPRHSPRGTVPRPGGERHARVYTTRRGGVGGHLLPPSARSLIEGHQSPFQGHVTQNQGPAPQSSRANQITDKHSMRTRGRGPTLGRAVSEAGTRDQRSEEREGASLARLRGRAKSDCRGPKEAACSLFCWSRMHKWQGRRRERWPGPDRGSSVGTLRFTLVTGGP